MSDNPDHTRRWLINASGAAILSNVLTGGPSSAQVAGTSTTKSQDPDEASADAPISPVTTALCDYVASALDRDMPPEVVAKAKLHTSTPSPQWYRARGSRRARWRPAMSTASAASPRRQ